MTSIIVRCDACHAQNRIPAARLAEEPHCAKCHGVLRSHEPLEVSGETLEGLIRESSLPLLVDFWAPWCGPCRAVAPVLKRIAERHCGKALVVKVNTDENPDAGAKHKVSGIPTLLACARGREVERLVGAHPEKAIEQLLHKTTAPA